ncbi:MAG: DUF2911 domain-containing protein [Gemmatimonadota bacterium]
MMKSVRNSALRLVGLTVGIALNAPAQPPPPACQWQGSHQWLSTRPSPLDSVILTMPALTLTVCYSRPSARGRSVFDSLAPFGKMWRTGANEPTTLRLSHKATVGGVSLAEGRYLLMTVPRPDRWFVLFFTTAATDPAAMFQNMTEAGRGFADVERLDAPVEQFTIRSDFTPAGAALLLEWGVLRARIPVVPQP